MSNTIQDVRLAHNTPENRVKAISIPSWVIDIEGDQLHGAALDWFCSTKPGLILSGPAGLGKTTIACNLMKDFALLGAGSMERWNLLSGAGEGLSSWHDEDGWPYLTPVLFMRFEDLIDSVRRNRRGEYSHEQGEILSQIAEHVVALCLDDIDLESVNRGIRQTTLLRIFEWSMLPAHRLILTMNTPVDEWREKFGDRISDRLVERGRFTLVTLEGSSFRIAN